MVGENMRGTLEDEAIEESKDVKVKADHSGGEDVPAAGVAEPEKKKAKDPEADDKENKGAEKTAKSVTKVDMKVEDKEL